MYGFSEACVLEKDVSLCETCWLWLSGPRCVMAFWSLEFWMVAVMVFLPTGQKGACQEVGMGYLRGWFISLKLKG